MDTSIRRKLMVMVGGCLADTMYFNSVYYESPPDSFPSALEAPAAYIVRNTESLEDFTDSEKRSVFGFDVIAVVHESNELELVKTDAEDAIEQALMALQVVADFNALFEMVKVESADPTPMALADLGHSVPVMPPFGVVRMKCHVSFSYTVRT